MIRLIGLAVILVSGEVWAEGFLYLPLQSPNPYITATYCGPGYITDQCHLGTDFDTTDTQTPVFTSASGKVTKIKDGYAAGMCKKCGFGNYISIQHPNGYVTIYAHLLKGSLLVSSGDQVTAGQQIATADNSGFSTGSHLHFEVKDPNSKSVDPYGNNANYPNCGPNALWAVCPPVPYNSSFDDKDKDGYTVAQGDCQDNNPTINPGVQELCDGIDNNCNNQTDENWAKVNQSCSKVQGVCITQGIWVCATDQQSVICTAPNPIMESEKCDSQDNDCDGLTDEDFKKGLAQDLGNLCTVGLGECQNQGQMVCTKDGKATVCSVDAKPLQQAEVCDGKDNDCDGTADEEMEADAYCDDDLWCNGIEICKKNVGCQAGLPPNASDGIDCTTDSCDEAQDKIIHIPDDVACSDNVVCNGVEKCDSMQGCLTGIPLPISSEKILHTSKQWDNSIPIFRKIAVDVNGSTYGLVGNKYYQLQGDALSEEQFTDNTNIASSCSSNGGFFTQPSCDLTIDSNGWTHICYIEDTNKGKQAVNKLWYATNQNGGVWENILISSQASSAYISSSNLYDHPCYIQWNGPSLTISYVDKYVDPVGFPWIVERVAYAVETESWLSQIVDDPECPDSQHMVGAITSFTLAFDNSGLPHTYYMCARNPDGWEEDGLVRKAVLSNGKWVFSNLFNPTDQTDWLMGGLFIQPDNTESLVFAERVKNSTGYQLYHRLGNNSYQLIDTDDVYSIRDIDAGIDNNDVMQVVYSVSYINSYPYDLDWNLKYAQWNNTEWFVWGSLAGSSPGLSLVGDWFEATYLMPFKTVMLVREQKPGFDWYYFLHEVSVQDGLDSDCDGQDAP